MNYYIPQKLLVGFNNRKDTYDGRLSFVIYYDEKNVLKQEKSLSNWETCKDDRIEIDNKPIKGIVLNKSIKRTGHFGSGRSLLRVYDPRGFEYEITVDNLAKILHCGSTDKGEFLGEFVYTWKGKDLYLLPTNTEEYKEALLHTKKQLKSITTKDLVVGYTYEKKKSKEELIYIGHLPYYEQNRKDENKEFYEYNKKKGKAHIFYNLNEDRFEKPTMSVFSECINASPSQNLNEILDKFYNSPLGTEIINLKQQKAVKNDNLIEKLEDYHTEGSSRFYQLNRNGSAYNTNCLFIKIKNIFIDLNFYYMDKDASTADILNITTNSILKFVEDKRNSLIPLYDLNCYEDGRCQSYNEWSQMIMNTEITEDLFFEELEELKKLKGFITYNNTRSSRKFDFLFLNYLMWKSGLNVEAKQKHFQIGTYYNESHISYKYVKELRELIFEKNDFYQFAYELNTNDKKMYTIEYRD